MRFKIEYNDKGKLAADHQHYIRGALIDAECMAKKLKTQGFEVVISNADTGFVISRR